MLNCFAFMIIMNCMENAITTMSKLRNHQTFMRRKYLQLEKNGNSTVFGLFLKI